MKAEACYCDGDDTYFSFPPDICIHCPDEEEISIQLCPRCNGSGEVVSPKSGKMISCAICGGTGEIREHRGGNHES